MKPTVLLATMTMALILSIGATVPPSGETLPPSGIIVTSVADSGPGTLREALSQAPSGALITFDPTVFPPDNPTTIYLLSPLTELAQGQITIDASDAGVILDGDQLPREEGGNGLTITSSGNVVRGLQIERFPENGISVRSGAQHNTIGGDRAQGEGPTGQGNVVSGNGIEGIRIEGVGTDHNLVIGNHIGTDASGTSALGSGFHGVSVMRGAQYNQIGGATAAERNVISGNSWDGVYVTGDGTMHNVISGNYLGTDASGTTSIPNGNFGVNLAPGAQRNLVGGGTAAEGNVISGNGAGGVNVAGSGVRDNVVRGNFIGVDVSGNHSLPNYHGVAIAEGASYNTIQGNVISGNHNGVNIAGSDTTSNIVIGNHIGTNAAGDAAIGNRVDGVWIGEGAQHNVVGGRKPEERNVISGNENNGVVMDASAYNTVSGNFIGTDASGTAPLGNLNIGVVLAWGARHNLVGGATPEERNLISASGNVGVSIANTDTMSNTVSGNYIGTDVTGTRALGNIAAGIWISESAQYNTVGGVRPEEANLISGNQGSGVVITDSRTMWNVVTGNHIGTDSTGAAALGNTEDGISIRAGAGQNTIGPANIIAHNGSDGVAVRGLETVGNVISANSIYGNEGAGIRCLNGGNAELSPPLLTYVGTRIIRGTAPPDSSIEIFSDEDDEARVFEGTTSADGEGNFTYRIPQGRITGPHVTASGTDAAGNTSALSAVASPPTPVTMRELPGLVGPEQVSLDPKIVGTNLGLALFCVLFFGLTSHIFNTILKEYRDDLLASGRRLVPRAIPGYVSKIGHSVGVTKRYGRGGLVLTWLAVLVLTSIIESFLDPGVAVLGMERIGLLVTLVVAAAMVSGLELGSDLYAHRRWAPRMETESKVQWLGIVVALGCVALSRGLDFRPGYLYGIVGAIYVLPELARVSEQGKRVGLVLLSVLGGGLILWAASALLAPALAELEPIFLTAFLIALEGVFFALIPVAFTDGGHLWAWRKSLWFTFFFVVLFCFYHFLLNPQASNVQALQQNGVRTLLVLIAVFGGATLLLWILFPFRLRRAKAAR